jgi:hypothetical protein
MATFGREYGVFSGTTKTDPDAGLGKPMDVAKASFDPGYDLAESLPDTSVADLKRGYASYGRSVGDK